MIMNFGGVILKTDELFSKADKIAIVKEAMEDIKLQMDDINQDAVKNFYSYKSGAKQFPYDRTTSFNSFVSDPKEIIKGDKYYLIYEYSASTVTVNPWASPYGVLDGDPEWAFETAFIHGYHGGPIYDMALKKWTWDIAQTDPIWDLICKGVDSLE